jgi:hypothetical protein
MAIGRHHPENEGFAARRESERQGEAVFIALLVCVLLAVVAATIVTVNGSNRRGGPLMARSDILYPVGK